MRGVGKKEGGEYDALFPGRRKKRRLDQSPPGNPCGGELGEGAAPGWLVRGRPVREAVHGEDSHIYTLCAVTPPRHQPHSASMEASWCSVLLNHLFLTIQQVNNSFITFLLVWDNHFCYKNMQCHPTPTPRPVINRPTADISDNSLSPSSPPY